jgi:hypothetical protein
MIFLHLFAILDLNDLNNGPVQLTSSTWVGYSSHLENKRNKINVAVWTTHRYNATVSKVKEKPTVLKINWACRRRIQLKKESANSSTKMSHKMKRRASTNSELVSHQSSSSIEKLDGNFCGAFQEHYEYLMDKGLIETCQVNTTYLFFFFFPFIFIWLNERLMTGWHDTEQWVFWKIASCIETRHWHLRKFRYQA